MSFTLMTAYIALARKWRPRQFRDLVGQKPVLQSLMNAIRKEQIHHAYVFAGSRGIGKTSIARIFAQAIRCENKTDDGQWIQSCEKCPSCLDIAAGRSVDVQEIDGASHNGVDAIRDISENVRYVANVGEHKIYIIDEVHMFTTAAFNAFLKTLEEPPPHVTFIAATTEPHKIPATVLSRCLRFDFRRISISEMVERLAQVCREEKIHATQPALNLIADNSEGSMRDSLSILDQVRAFAGDSLDLGHVESCLGLMSTQSVLDFVRLVLGRDSQKVLSRSSEFYASGFDIRVLTQKILEVLHQTVSFQAGLPCPQDWDQEKLKELAGLRSPDELLLVFQIYHYGLESFARSTDARLAFDILSVKATRLVFTESEQEVPKKVLGAAQSGISAELVADKTPVKVEPQKVIPPQEGKSWAGFVEFVRPRRPLLATTLSHAVSAEIALDGAIRRVKIFFPLKSAFASQHMTNPIYAEQLQVLGAEYFGGPARFTVESVAGETPKQERTVQNKRDNEASAFVNQPVIQEALALLGGKIGSVQVRGEVHDD